MTKGDRRKWGAIAVGTDLLCIALYWAARPALYSRFQEKSTINALLVLLLYLVFCLSVYLIRRSNPNPGSRADPRGVLALLGVFFGFMLTFMALDLAGILDHLDRLNLDLDSLAVSLGLTVATLLYFGLIFLYPAILWADLRPLPQQVRESSVLESLSLGGVNLTIIATAVHWEVFFADTEPYESVTLGGKLLIFSLVLVFFLLFYAPPRLLFLIRKPAPLAGVSFLFQCGIYVYWSLSASAW